MPILKLREAGETATLAITACDVVEGEYGEQVLFIAGDDSLYLPKSSADRQLERLGLTYDGAVGEQLTFSRAPNAKPGSKPFWNIARANGKPPVAARPASAGASAPNEELPELLRDTEQEEKAALAAKVDPPADPVHDALKKNLALYQGLTEWVHKHIAPVYIASEVGTSPESLAACVNTLYISAKKA